MKKITLAILIILLTITSFPSFSQAERIFGRGAGYVGLTPDRTYSSNDETVIPPLGLAWRTSLSSSVPSPELTLTQYRLQFGQGRRLLFRNNQTGSSSANNYVVGNPFDVSWTSGQGGTITTAVESGGTLQHSESYCSISGDTTMAVFGTSDGRIGALLCLDTTSKNNDVHVRFSEQLVSGRIHAVARPRGHEQLVAVSDRQITAISTRGPSYAVNFPTPIWRVRNSSGERFTNITRYEAGSGYTRQLLISGESSSSSNQGKIWFYDGDSTSRMPFSSVFRDFEMTAEATLASSNSRVPKAPTFDSQRNRFYVLDEAGRLYVINATTNRGARIGDTAYVGEREGGGNNTVGGVALEGNYIYTSSLQSGAPSTGILNRGTVTRHHVNDPRRNKLTYTHSRPVTTTPIVSQGLVYFGDDQGRIFALNPSNMTLVNWYNDHTFGSPQQSFNTGSSPIRYLLTADSHLYAVTDSEIIAFKGRPNFQVTDHRVGNQGNATLSGYRINYTNGSFPTLRLDQHIRNNGTHDYKLYPDFGGENTQLARMTLTNRDTGNNVSLSNSNASNTAPSGYKHSSNPYRFQVQSGSTYQLRYNFRPSEEGRYRLTTQANADGTHDVFSTSGSSRTSDFDVVDMTKPTVSTNRPAVNRGDPITLQSSFTQRRSNTGYRIQIRTPSGSNVVNVSTNGNLPSNYTYTPPSNAPVGDYRYRVAVDNRYGDTIWSDWGEFSVYDVSFSPNSQTSWTNSPLPVTLNINGFGNGIRDWRYQLSTDGGSSYGSWSSYYTSTSRSITLSSDHEYRIRLQVRDRSGNSKNFTSGVYRIDLTDPNVVFNPNSRSWTNQNITVNASLSDNLAGIKRWRSRQSLDGSWGTWSADRTTTSHTFTLSQEGQHSLRIEAEDQAGNLRTFTSGIYQIDKTPPVIHVSGVENGRTYVHESVTPVISFSDVPSGVKNGTQQITLTRQWYNTPQTVPFVSGTRIEDAGYYTLNMSVEDLAGNKTTRTITFKIERPPILGLDISDNFVYPTKPRLQFSDYSVVSPYAREMTLYYEIREHRKNTNTHHSLGVRTVSKLTRSSTSEPFNTTAWNTINLTESVVRNLYDGRHSIRMWIEDEYGYRSEVETFLFSADTRPPTNVNIRDLAPLQNVALNSTVRLGLTATDSSSIDGSYAPSHILRYSVQVLHNGNPYRIPYDNQVRLVNQPTTPTYITLDDATFNVGDHLEIRVTVGDERGNVVQNPQTFRIVVSE